jgi:mono/diheme cytochrome c family protein
MNFKKMNKVDLKIKSIASIVVFSALALTSCKSDDSPFYEYMPDMYRSAAIETYVDYGEVRERYDIKRATKISAKTPPKGAIPFYGTDKEEVLIMLPYHRRPGMGMDITHNHFGMDLAPDALAEYNAAAEDKNPITLKEETAEDILNFGKSVYGKQCQHCHGEVGDGKGPMVESGAYSGVPNYKNLLISEGQMFYSIYYGKGLMGAHSHTVSKKEIWSIVHYIRRLQDANYGKFGAIETMESDSTMVQDTLASMN